MYNAVIKERIKELIQVFSKTYLCFVKTMFKVFLVGAFSLYNMKGKIQTAISEFVTEWLLLNIIQSNWNVNTRARVHPHTQQFGYALCFDLMLFTIKGSKPESFICVRDFWSTLMFYVDSAACKAQLRLQILHLSRKL